MSRGDVEQRTFLNSVLREEGCPGRVQVSYSEEYDRYEIVRRSEDGRLFEILTAISQKELNLTARDEIREKLRQLCQRIQEGSWPP